MFPRCGQLIRAGYYIVNYFFISVLHNYIKVSLSDNEVHRQPLASFRRDEKSETVGRRPGSVPLSSVCNLY